MNSRKPSYAPLGVGRREVEPQSRDSVRQPDWARFEGSSGSIGPVEGRRRGSEEIAADERRVRGSVSSVNKIRGVHAGAQPRGKGRCAAGPRKRVVAGSRSSEGLMHERVSAADPPGWDEREPLDDVLDKSPTVRLCSLSSLNALDDAKVPECKARKPCSSGRRRRQIRNWESKKRGTVSWGKWTTASIDKRRAAVGGLADGALQGELSTASHRSLGCKPHAPRIHSGGDWRLKRSKDTRGAADAMHGFCCLHEETRAAAAVINPNVSGVR